MSVVTYGMLRMFLDYHKTKKPLLKGKASHESIPMKIGTYYFAVLNWPT